MRVAVAGAGVRGEGGYGGIGVIHRVTITYEVRVNGVRCGLLRLRIRGEMLRVLTVWWYQ